MSDEIIKTGESWYAIECECPYCGNVQMAVDIPPCTEYCENKKCNKEFDIEEPTL